MFFTKSNEDNLQLAATPYSSWIRTAVYNKDAEQLTLTTKLGAIIRIGDVSEELFHSFRYSTSAGRFFNRHLKAKVLPKGGAV
jgi:hypothetical protein